MIESPIKTNLTSLISLVVLSKLVIVFWRILPIIDAGLRQCRHKGFVIGLDCVLCVQRRLQTRPLRQGRLRQQRAGVDIRALMAILVSNPDIAISKGLMLGF